MHEWALIEAARYAEAYRSHYSMGASRLAQARRLLGSKPTVARRGLLDVGCGRGEVLDLARALGYWPVQGAEIVEALCVSRADVVLATADDLPWPDGHWHDVTCFDVLEHLPEHAIGPTLAELDRVCCDTITLTISCRPDSQGPALGIGSLHLTVWPPEQWLDALQEAWPCRAVEWHVGEDNRVSELYTAR